jgi:hypothetical protein
MRTILRTKQFKKDYKRALAGRFGGELNGLLSNAVLLAKDEALPVS